MKPGLSKTHGKAPEETSGGVPAVHGVSGYKALPGISVHKWFSGLTPKTIVYEFGAGAAAGLLVFACCVSYAVLIFQGELAEATPSLIWGFLISAAVTGLVAGGLTTVKPLGYAPDSAAVGLLAPLAASVASSAAAAGGNLAGIAATATIAIWLTGVLAYGAMWALGAFRVASLARFVPYSVVAGFLGATGFLLIAAGVSLSIGGTFGTTVLAGELGLSSLEKLCASLAVAVIFILLRTYERSRKLLFIYGSLAAVVIGTLVHLAAFSTANSSLFIKGVGEIAPWFPYGTLLGNGVQWPAVASHLGQIIAVVIVVQISNVVKVSTVEVTHSAAGNLDAEFRYNGAGALAAACFGGIGASISSGVSNLLINAGGRTRLSGLFASFLVGAVLALKIDFVNFVPIPFLSGLAIYLGFVLLADSFRRLLVQRAWLDLVPALAIMLICLRFGHMTGVAAGIVLACILFSYSYAKLGPVKRRVTGATLSSHVERGRDQAATLRDCGESIHVYWISGYLFFGSSDRVLEEVRRRAASLEPGRPQAGYVVLDMTEVSGMDSSAVVSLIKLQNFCAQRSIHLMFCGLGDALKEKLKRGGMTGFAAFQRRNDALAWCEGDLLASKDASFVQGSGELQSWLAKEVGPDAMAILPYFLRKPLKAGDLLYAQGDPAETIDLVAEGSLAIVLKRDNADDMPLRLMTTQTVVGEMGFFRNAKRAASVLAAEDGVIYSLSREGFERMQKENPAMASQFLQFIIRTLSDRVDFSNRQSAALM